MIDSNKTLRFNRTLKECGWDDHISSPDSGYTSLSPLVAWTVGLSFAVLVVINLIRRGV